MQNWSLSLSRHVDTPQNVSDFLTEYKALCQKYNLSLGHEDTHGAFIIDVYNEYDIDWVRQASLAEGVD